MHRDGILQTEKMCSAYDFLSCLFNLPYCRRLVYRLPVYSPMCGVFEHASQTTKTNKFVIILLIYSYIVSGKGQLFTIEMDEK